MLCSTVSITSSVSADLRDLLALSLPLTLVARAPPTRAISLDNYAIMTLESIMAKALPLRDVPVDSLFLSLDKNVVKRDDDLAALREFFPHHCRAIRKVLNARDPAAAVGQYVSASLVKEARKEEHQHIWNWYHVYHIQWESRVLSEAEFKAKYHFKNFTQLLETSFSKSRCCAALILFCMHPD